MPSPVTPSQIKNAIVSVGGPFCDSFRRGFSLPGLAATFVGYWMNPTGTGFTDDFKTQIAGVDCSIFNPPVDPDPSRVCDGEPLLLNWGRVDSLNTGDYGALGATCALYTQVLTKPVPGTLGVSYLALVRVRGVVELKSLDSALTYTGPFYDQAGGAFNTTSYNEIRLNTPGLGPNDYLLNVGNVNSIPKLVDYCMQIPVEGQAEYILNYYSGLYLSDTDRLQWKNFNGIVSPPGTFDPDVPGAPMVVPGQFIQLSIISLSEIT